MVASRETTTNKYFKHTSFTPTSSLQFKLPNKHSLLPLRQKKFTNSNNQNTHPAMDMQGTPIGGTNQGMKVRQSSRLLSSQRPNAFSILMLTRSPRTRQTPNAIRTQRVRVQVPLPPTLSPQNQPPPAANSARTVTQTLSRSKGIIPP